MRDRFIDTDLALDAVIDLANVLNVLAGKPEWEQDRAARRIERLMLDGLAKLKKAGVPVPEPGDEDGRPRRRKARRKGEPPPAEP